MLWCGSWQHTLTSSLFVVLICPIHIAQSSAQSVWGTDSAVPAKLQHLLIPQHIQHHPAMGTSVMLSGLRWVCTKSHRCVSVAIGLAFWLLFLWCTSRPISIIEGKSITWVIICQIHYSVVIFVLLCALFEQLQHLKEKYLLDMNELYGMLSTRSNQVCISFFSQPTSLFLYGSAICSL